MTPKRKLVTALAAVLLLAGIAGVAVAANHAGLDLALEKASAGNGEAAERLEEAQTLAANGQGADAIAQLSSEGDPDFGDAAEALRDAADNVESNGAEQSQDVRAKVAAMLRWIAGQFDEEEFDGRAFGEELSIMARQIAGAPQDLPVPADTPEVEEVDDDEGPPEDVPVGPPDDVPPDPPARRGG